MQLSAILAAVELSGDSGKIDITTKNRYKIEPDANLKNAQTEDVDLHGVKPRGKALTSANLPAVSAW